MDEDHKCLPSKAPYVVYKVQTYQGMYRLQPSGRHASGPVVPVYQNPPVIIAASNGSLGPCLDNNPKYMPNTCDQFSDASRHRAVADTMHNQYGVERRSLESEWSSSALANEYNINPMHVSVLHEKRTKDGTFCLLHKIMMMMTTTMMKQAAAIGSLSYEEKIK